MTSASAERFGLANRGKLAAGYAADIVVFDPEVISDRTPGDGQPAQRPVGIEQVFVNGAQVVKKGRVVTREGAGRVIRT